MDHIAIVLVVLAVLLTMLAIRVPVAFSLGIAGALGLLLLQGFAASSRSIGSLPFSSTASLSLAVVPMFIMMGMLAQAAGVPEHLFRIADRLLHKLPGGLAISAVAAGAGFGAVTGSSVASAATIGRLSIGEMLKYGYKKPFAAGVVAMAGTLGVLIPPSVILVLIGVATGESIGKLLLAGIIPGILSAVVFAGFVLFRATFMTRSVFEAGTDFGASRGGQGAWKQAQFADESNRPAVKVQWRFLIWIGVVFLIVVGGIYTGIFTATESGAIGALVLALVLVWERRRSGARGVLRYFRSALVDTASTTSMMLAIVVGAALFSNFLVRSGLTAAFTGWISSLSLPGPLIVILLIVVLILLGTILETFSLVLIAVPLIYPVVMNLGFDGIWFGVIAAKAIEIGLITPPVGMNAFVVAGTTRGLTVEDTFRGIAPFYLAELLIFAMLFLIPGLVTWLPATMQ